MLILWVSESVHTITVTDYNHFVLLSFIGIAVGHTYYYLEDVFPNRPGGIKLIKTPGFM